ncbi:hypothetical protein WR25_13540 [Diploscapter pachys]|uniref:Neurotransmitter-gated ion-channel transmembrane domain-containing protein n=1 Tax=Diploscapter pachys TaxID=2018661 RepID=A0A2A2JCE4_9BILA|nr:hypothetical protein WR25_13540 [Diploscapter pachys]
MPDMKMGTIDKTTRMDEYATGIWSCAIATFHGHRELTHHILQSYIPTALIVFVSWFSFWLDVEAVPGRVSLSITTLLTLATQSSAARMSLPQASDVKAIDIWMGTCMTFVFLAMIEFTIVNYCTRRKNRRNRKKSVKGLSDQVHELVSQYKEKKNQLLQRNGTSCYEVAMLPADPESQEKIDRKQIRELNQAPPLYIKRNLLPSSKRKALEERISRVEENRKFAQAIDRNSRIYFPLTFGVFNILYWGYYLKFATDEY